jgi:ABC-2 type transport system permease protein
VCAALLLCAEYPLIVMVRRELTRYFCTPIAYIVLLACVGLSWLLFYVFVEVLNNVARGGEAFREPIVGQYLFGTLAFLPVVSLMIIVPLVTMGVLSEERRTGTMEMLLTVQLSEASIVISKFIAALVLFMVFWLPWAGYLVSLRIFDEQFFDYRPLLSFYIAIFCMGFNFVAMGLFFSSLTQNQLTAGILSFLAMMLLVVCYFLEGMNKGKLLGDIFEHSSFIDLWSDAAQGKLALRRLIYHLSAGIFWLVLSVKVLEVRRWK